MDLSMGDTKKAPIWTAPQKLDALRIRF
jgi:hypothetical protein